jgi:hypothetical protein
MNNQEEWRDVDWSDGIYQVSNLGRVRSKERVVIRSDGRNLTVRAKILRQNKNQGYPSVKMMKNRIGTTVKVHRLIAKAFIPNPENKKNINHIDGSRDNNSISNLEWCTFSENTKHAYKTGAMTPKKGSENGYAKLTERDIMKIKEMLSSKSVTHREIALKFNVARTTVTAINRNQNWNHT